MNIDVELFRLIQKYDIFATDPRLKELYVYDYFSATANKIINSIPEGKSIAIRGNGLHTEQLFKVLGEEQKQRISCFIDKDYGWIPEGRDIPNIIPEEIGDTNIDVIILSTFKWRKDFMAHLIDYMPQIKVIDIYDVCERQKVFFEKEFYLYASQEMKHINYIDTAIAYKQYRSSMEQEERKFYLERLIAYLIEIKDFLSAFKLMGTLIDSGMDGNGRYADFMKDLRAFLQKISSVLKNRKEKDIIINWIDGVNADEFYQTDFGKARKEDSYCFDNAFTNCPWTYLTTCAIFTGKLPIDGKTYIKQLFTYKNSELLSFLREQGYSFKYISYPGTYQKWFEDQANVLHHPKGFEPKSSTLRASNGCSTRLHWYSLRERLQSKKHPVCHLIHNLGETHNPYYYSLMESAVSNRRNRNKSFPAILEQIEWYNQFLSENTIEVYISDHGPDEKRPYCMEQTNIPVVVKGKNIPQETEKRLYSHQYFAALIQAVVYNTEEEWSKVFSETIAYQNTDFMNFSEEMSTLYFCMNNQAAPPMRYYQCRAIRTLDDIYVRYAIGKECYYKLPDEKTNLIGEEKYQHRVAYLRELCGDNFIDISSNKHFRQTQLLYSFLKLIPPDRIEW